MTVRTTATLANLYRVDETAWLEVMAKLAAERRADEFDFDNLSEFLDSMAQRDRREVVSRLVILLTHLLRLRFQPERETSSWLATVAEQQRELAVLFESGTLRNHAETKFPEAYGHARWQAATETGLTPSTFPNTSPWTLDEALVAHPDYPPSG